MTETGIWNQREADLYHASSPKLAAFLASYLNVNSIVYDFGCGTAYYLAELASVGFKCIGVEGYELKTFQHRPIIIHDLTEPMDFSCPGQVLSFETGEHLPKGAEQIFLNTLTNNCGSKLIMSWATEGQPGIGHVNCRNHDYIIKEVQRRGFKLLIQDTAEIRKHVDLNCDWLIRNLLVFEKIDKWKGVIA